MPNDRELLELAAKAAGIGGGWGDQIEYHNGAVDLRDMWILDGEDFIPWNPLTDDGDALRLAVKLRLEISVFRDHSTAYHASGWCDENHESDANSAARRAIVRAAAEIGRGMP